MICVLTYDAPHRKTQDLLFRLKCRGHDNIRVLATPWEERTNFKPLIPHRWLSAVGVHPEDLSKKLGFEFEKITLDDASPLADCEWTLIGGAGILGEEVVNSRKVINSHPAYLPYVRGLDSFKWAIYRGLPIGVTTHIVSEECDTGFLIRREMLPIYSWDTFHSAAQRQYEMEIDLLVDSLEDVKTASLEPLSANDSPVHRRISHRKEARLIKRFELLVDKSEI